MDHQPRRSSNVHENLRAGRYQYVDFPGALPQLVEVTYIEGVPVARFLDAEPEDRDLELDPRDMAGEFQPVPTA